MPGTLQRIGPFTGGLNTKSDPSALADNELAICENFELDLDGSLRTRPPLINRNITMPLDTTGEIKMLGWYRAAAGANYLIASDGLSSTYYFNGSTWARITNTVAAVDIAQFQGLLYLLAPISSSNPGGTWNGSTFTAVPNMPKGVSIAVYKTRLFIGAGAGSSTPGRLWRSQTVLDPNLWLASNDFADVGYGDGQAVVSLQPTQNYLLVFRSESIWSYSYANDPVNAIAQVMVPNVGLENDQAIENLDGIYYFLYESKAYALQNNRAVQINEKVPFIADTRSGFAAVAQMVSVLNRRVIFSFFSQAFVFNVEMQTWCTWTSTVWGGIGKVLQRSGLGDVYPVAYTHSTRTHASGSGRTAQTVFITDIVATSETETFTCTMQTKNLDYGASSAYKRLFWWGLDGLFRNQLTAIANPISFSGRITWKDLRSYTWDDLLNFTWDQPTSPSLAVTSNRDAAGTGPVKKFVKLSKALRFRQIYFKITCSTNGDSATAPVRIFDLVTFVLVKEHVVRTLS